MLSPGFTWVLARCQYLPHLGSLVLRVPHMLRVAEGEDALLGARFLLVAARTAESSVVTASLERLLQRLRLHDVGIERAAMGDRRDAVLRALLVGMDQQL